jgi:hypothetical protein
MTIRNEELVTNCRIRLAHGNRHPAVHYSALDEIP